MKEMPGFRHADRACSYWRGRKTPAASADILDQLEDPGSGLNGEWDRQHGAVIRGRAGILIPTDYSGDDDVLNQLLVRRRGRIEASSSGPQGDEILFICEANPILVG